MALITTNKNWLDIIIVSRLCRTGAPCSPMTMQDEFFSPGLYEIAGGCLDAPRFIALGGCIQIVESLCETKTATAAPRICSREYI